MELQFQNPVNGYIESCPHAWIWCLLFGGFYFIYKRIWTHVIIGFVAAILTMGISWFVYPFFVKQILIKHYLRNGWVQVQEVSEVAGDTSQAKLE
jgi:hypothetical protein